MDCTATKRYIYYIMIEFINFQIYATLCNVYSIFDFCVANHVNRKYKKKALIEWKIITSPTQTFLGK